MCFQWVFFPIYLIYLPSFYELTLTWLLLNLIELPLPVMLVYYCVFTESSSTSVVVGSVLGSLLFLAIGAVVFISYKYLSGFQDFYINK